MGILLVYWLLMGILPVLSSVNGCSTCFFFLYNIINVQKVYFYNISPTRHQRVVCAHVRININVKNHHLCWEWGGYINKYNTIKIKIVIRGDSPEFEKTVMYVLRRACGQVRWRWSGKSTVFILIERVIADKSSY